MILNDYTPAERYAAVTYRLAQGEAFTTRAVSSEFGISKCGALRLLDRISRVVPLEKYPEPDTSTGRSMVWRLIDFDIDYDEGELDG